VTLVQYFAILGVLVVNGQWSWSRGRRSGKTLGTAEILAGSFIPVAALWAICIFWVGVH